MIVRLAIVEDHPAIAGAPRALAGRARFDGHWDGPDSVAADRLIAVHSPDVILCDIIAGTVDGLEILARHTPGPAFIMLSAYSYSSYYVAAVEHGAKGYLSKMAGIEQNTQGMRMVAAGGTAFPRRTTSAGAVRTALRPPTPREAQILALVAEGQAERGNRRTPVAPVKTVESQLRRMFDRYDVTSRTSLVRVAQRQGWIEGIANQPVADTGALKA